MLCNGPEACSVGEEGLASSWASQGDDSTEERIKKHVGGVRLWESPLITFSNFLLPFPLLLCTFLRCFSSGASLRSPSSRRGCLRMAQRRENAPGSLCDTVMRGDVVIQQFLPKGHICSLSFCSPYLSESLFIYRGCTRQSLPGHQRVLTTHSA